MSPPAPPACCDHCGGGDFVEAHTWPVGDFWNPSSVPLSVWTCQGCQLMALHPVPTAAQLPDEGDWWGKSKPRFRRRRWLKRIWEPLRAKITGGPQAKLIRATLKAQPGGRLLDIGCGTGTLINEARPHYQCVGVEPSPIAAERCREQGIEVLQGMFEDVEVDWGGFDVVVMSAVIEHVLSPTESLQRMNRCLKPGGVVCLKTPNLGGPSYRRHGAAWNGFRHGYHTYLFTPQTLGAVMEKTGFEVLRRPRRGHRFDDILVLWGRKVRESSDVRSEAA